MQTFLPYPSHRGSAAVLDQQRLGKQRVEALQLLRTLYGESPGWSNHPATCMWAGCEFELAKYGVAVCEEWISRGYRDTCLPKMQAYLIYGLSDKPAWWGNEEFHASHRSNLLRKDPGHYGSFGWSEPADLPYVWPC
jgi:hypothetical protein